MQAMPQGERAKKREYEKMRRTRLLLHIEGRLIPSVRFSLFNQLPANEIWKITEAQNRLSLPQSMFQLGERESERDIFHTEFQCLCSLSNGPLFATFFELYPHTYSTSQ